MTTTERHGLVSRRALLPDEVAQANALVARANAAEGLELKVVPALAQATDSGDGVFCWYVDGALVGLCTRDGSDEVELCAAVDPAYRRRGIGRQLLRAALAESVRHGATRALLICEQASHCGQGFVAATGATYRFAEHRMMRETALPLAESGSVRLEQATGADLDVLARVRAVVFDEAEAETRVRCAEELADPTQRIYLGWLDGATVGCLRLYDVPPRAYLYGFGVVPAHRRRGLGRQLLAQAIRLAREEGRDELALEVETTNTPAYTLYTTMGFRVVTTYGYYELAL
jgi:ribosomal protein S18 acetylase RimI-like enzyme